MGVIRSDFKKHSFHKSILLILYNSRVTSGLLWRSFWDRCWHMKVAFGAFRGHFEATLSISTSNMCDACVMHTCTGVVGPKTGKVKRRSVFKSMCEGVKISTSRFGKRTSERAEPLLSHFGVTFGIFG